tara:strand:+ start:122 stop:328 length:207 start_codon:yes stop_codon:yes gene_type:complete
MTNYFDVIKAYASRDTVTLFTGEVSFDTYLAANSSDAESVAAMINEAIANNAEMQFYVVMQKLITWEQ